MNFLNVACSLAHASLSLSLSVHSSWPSLALPVVVLRCGKCEDTASPRAPGESQAVERDSLLCSPFTSPFLSPIIPSFLPFCPSFLSVFLPCIFHHHYFSPRPIFFLFLFGLLLFYFSRSIVSVFVHFFLSLPSLELRFLFFLPRVFIFLFSSHHLFFLCSSSLFLFSFSCSCIFRFPFALFFYSHCVSFTVCFSI